MRTEMTGDTYQHNELCVGIDLGTTNSVAAVINERPNGDIVSKVTSMARAVDMYNAVSGGAKLTTERRETIPSVVYYRQENGYEPLVGDFAKRQYPLRPHLVARSIKSQMGNPLAQGISPDIPDKTPAQISSRILQHIVKELKKVYHCDITDAVITVPANFDSAMCRATRDAAELAGIRVREADGSERPVLLSEPNAVIYDLVNQIHNGEISSRILDLSTQKTVLVFDLGGGTLDITMHVIKRREDHPEILKVDEIATNRYTLLGGDDFDEAIAQTMYERYLGQYAKYPEVVLKLRQDKNVIMPLLRIYAENLKLELGEKCGDDYSSGWDDEEETEFTTGGNIGGIGYSYDDSFTQEEIEKILSVFMADELSFFDYKRLDSIKNTRNIIYPILDVLKKASEKLKVEDVQVDAVLVNGGMSKFYMVTDRLKEFFGFDPIVALDPDQAVARGAAVYHHYLHKYAEMQEDMVKPGGLGRKIPGISEGEKRSLNTQNGRVIVEPPIEWGNSILNDSLYLGIRNGAVQEIIPTGTELPYLSKTMSGFGIEPGQQMISVPIKSRNLDGTYRTISAGKISFKQKYPNGAYVAFRVRMGSNKVITMNAWTSRDKQGSDIIEEGSVEISIDNGERTNIKTKFMAPNGAVLNPKAEINNVLQLAGNMEKTSGKGEKSLLAKRLAACCESICNAGNREAFAEPVLSALSETLSNNGMQEAKMRLFIIARKIGSCWSDDQKRRLAKACINQLGAALQGMSMGGGPRVSTNMQAIYTMGMCAGEADMNRLEAVHENRKYLQCCLYVHAQTGTCISWLREQFENDAALVKRRMGSNIQFSSHAIGMALSGKNRMLLSASEKEKIVKQLGNVIGSGNLSHEELICCILALGYICDQREADCDLNQKMLQSAMDTIREIDFCYPVLVAMGVERAREVAGKMINGIRLDEEEEQFLLKKLAV